MQTTKAAADCSSIHPALRWVSLRHRWQPDVPREYGKGIMPNSLKAPLPSTAGWAGNIQFPENLCLLLTVNFGDGTTATESERPLSMAGMREENTSSDVTFLCKHIHPVPFSVLLILVPNAFSKWLPRWKPLYRCKPCCTFKTQCPVLFHFIFWMSQKSWKVRKIALINCATSEGQEHGVNFQLLLVWGMLAKTNV